MSDPLQSRADALYLAHYRLPLREIGGLSAMRDTREGLEVWRRFMALRVQDGDGEAREALVASLYPLAVDISQRMMGDFDGEDQDDAIQSALGQFSMRIELYDHQRGASFASWAGRCLKYGILSHRRKITRPSRTMFAPASDWLDLVADGEAHSASLTDCGERARIEARDELERALDGISYLSPSQQAVLRLAAQGLSVPEISRRCGWSVSASQEHLSQGRKALRRFLRYTE